jgi:Ca-activated chloride channel family protein
MIVEIAQEAWLLSNLTGSADALNRAVERIGMPEGKESPMLGPKCRNKSFPRSCGGTALWHGLYYTAQEMRNVKGRKAIVVLSDGIDTGSDVSLSNLVEAAQSAETVVYAIKYASPARFISPAAALAQALSRGMERLTRETGGLIFANPGRKTEEVFAKIESDLRNLYVLGFSPPAEARDGKFHKLDVKVTRGDCVVRFRTGYLARN